jgi:putative transposase
MRACGIKRFVYNWGLAERKKLYEKGEKISGFNLKKNFNSIKKDSYSFVTEVSKCVSDNALLDLDRAYSNFFRELKKGNKKSYPKFKKKGVKDSFRIDNDKVTIKENAIRIPKLGYVRMSENLRFTGKIMSVTVSKKANRWFVSISVAVELSTETQGDNKCGIDLGIKNLMVTSNGEVYGNPNEWKRDLQRVQRLSKSLSRKQKKSKNFRKSKDRLANYWLKLTDKRNDALHKMTSEISTNYSVVVLEDLKVTELMGNKRLARKIQNSMFREIRRQLEYKTEVIVINQFFPSTQLCPSCGRKNKLELNERVYKCKCGYGPVDRDLHAAQNILRAGCPEVKPVKAASDSACAAAAVEAGNTHNFRQVRREPL